MAPRTVYAGLQDGLQFLSLWDASLADMGKLGITPCTAAGTNAVVLTPIAAVFAPTVTIPQSLQQFSFTAAATSTGSITVQIGTTTALKLYKEDGTTQAAANDLIINVLYGIVYNSALNSGAGGFQIVFPITSIINPIISGATITGSTITTSTYNGNTWTAGTGILTIAALKTLTANNTLTLSGTDGTTLTFPTTNATIARTDAGQTFTGTNAFGVLTATTVNGNTFTTGTYTLTGAASKTLTFNNSLTLSGTDATTMTFPTTTATMARTDAGQTFTGTQNFASLTISSAVATDGSKNLVSVTNTGSGNNVLATSPALTTPNIGAATATSVTFSPTTGGPVGTTTNDNASAGTVGEYSESVVASGSATSVTTNTAKDITTLTLGAGDWEIRGNVSYITTATTSVTSTFASISQTLNTLDQTAGRATANFFGAIVPTAGTNFQVPIGPVRFSLSGSTTFHLVALTTFTASTMTAYGIIGARRVR